METIVTEVTDDQDLSEILNRLRMIGRFIRQDLNFADNTKNNGYKNYDELQKSLLKIWTLIFLQPEQKIWKQALTYCFVDEKEVLTDSTENNKKELELTGSFEFEMNSLLQFTKSLEEIEFWSKPMSFKPSLVGIHLRTPFVKKGRMSAALDSCLGNPSSQQRNPWRFHQRLLDVYFEIYGRHRTLNEFVFNRLSAEKKIEFSMLTVEFVNEVTKDDFLTVKVTKRPKAKFEKTVIRISNTLRDILLPDALQKSFFDKITTKEHNDIDNAFLKDWLPRLRLIEEQDGEYMINKLSECIEDAYCRYTSHSTKARVQWIKLFNYVLVSEQMINGDFKWNRESRTNAKNILKALQGICLYQYFAKSSITSLAYEVEEEPGHVVGVTLGFDQRQLDNLFDTLQGVFSDCKESILLKRIKSRPSKLEEPWNVVIAEEDVSEMSAMRLAKLYDRLQQLSYTQHEGTPLTFTAYVGDQTLMSRFRCISELDANTDDEEVIGYYNNEGWHNMCKSHYSLFLDGRTGLFFDEASDHHVALVHPLQFPEEHKKREHKFNLDDLEITSGDPGTAEYFSSFSSKCPGLVIVSIGEARLVIYHNGKAILESSNRTDFELKYVNANSEIVNWSLENLKELFKSRIFINLSPSLQPYKISSINFLAAAICHVSDRPGCGGMIIFVNTPETSEQSMAQSGTADILEGMRTNLNDKQISYWKKGHLYDHTSQSLINMMIPDGSMLINLSDFRIESQVYVVPIDEKGNIVQGTPESGKGTRHRAASGISSVKYMNNDIWSVCISADGGISVYSGGFKKSPGDFSNTDKLTLPK